MNRIKNKVHPSRDKAVANSINLGWELQYRLTRTRHQPQITNAFIKTLLSMFSDLLDRLQAI